eukprot:6469141-Lingulodinium_polyedra.AAC.1
MPSWSLRKSFRTSRGKLAKGPFGSGRPPGRAKKRSGGPRVCILILMQVELKNGIFPRRSRGPASGSKLANRC